MQLGRSGHAGRAWGADGCNQTGENMDRFLRASRALLLVSLVGLSGCANLGAVREFAETSSQITGFQGVTERVISSPDRTLADLPATPAYAAARAKQVQLQTELKAQRETLLKLHKTTTGYMAALSGLAGKDAYAISEEINGVAGAITASDLFGVSDDHVNAYASIASKVSNWALAAAQARDVKRMVKDYGPQMSVLLDALGQTLVAYEFVLRQESANAKAVHEARLVHWNSQPGDRLTPGRLEAVRALSVRSFNADQAERDRAAKARDDLAKGVAKVRAGHTQLVENVDRLSSKDVQALLKQATADLKVIRANLQKL